jgi:DNA-binding NtrC family response regulator
MSAQIKTTPRPRVLFIDDEPRVLNSMRIMFRREYDLCFAKNGKEALGLLSTHDIDVIVCDHRMPQMTGVELLARAKKISPRSVRILLTGYADLNAVEGSINEGEVFRFLTKPCAPATLKETVRLAAELALDPEANPALAGGEEEDADSDADVEALLATEPGPAAPVTSLHPTSGAGKAGAQSKGFDGTATDILDRPPVLPAQGRRGPAPPHDRRRLERARETQPTVAAPKAAAQRPRLRPGFAVLVFSSDEDTYNVISRSMGDLVPVYRATNIVQVVKILNAHKPGVLLTDVSEEKTTIQTMTAQLKKHLPQLVTIAVSEHRDVLDMVWLINHGQIFRFLRKPLSPGRCAVSIKAALQYHRKLLTNPALVKRHAVESTDESGATEGFLSRLSFLKKLWSGA